VRLWRFSSPSGKVLHYERALHFVPAILSGGSGTRLWPVSRKSFPKQLWPLVFDRILIQETVLPGRGPGFATRSVEIAHQRPGNRGAMVVAHGNTRIAFRKA